MNYARRTLPIALVLVLLATTSDAALTTPKCLAGKARAAASFRKCRIDAEAKLLEGKEASLMKCDLTFDAKRAKLDAKAAKAGIKCRFRDNGDGTVTDYDTGLHWEQKNSPDGVAYAPNPHDIDNFYGWTTVTNIADGTLFTDFLGRLNGSVDGLFDVRGCVASDTTDVDGGFGGHCDWRLPTIVELVALVDPTVPGCGTVSACIDPIFGVSTLLGSYATSTTSAVDEAKLWYVYFGAGNSGTDLKGLGYLARAVRGGW